MRKYTGAIVDFFQKRKFVKKILAQNWTQTRDHNFLKSPKTFNTVIFQLYMRTHLVVHLLICAKKLQMLLLAYSLNAFSTSNIGKEMWAAFYPSALESYSTVKKKLTISWI